ncbi:RNA pseudouridylate synthase domain-containing protein 3, partial [Eschrichtius robustus]|nr:RNA pseudouridylate synthase domain-containing protein 3 [Eschrichtius robustus]
MGGCRVLGRVWGGWRRGPGVRAAPTASSFGTEARHQQQRRGSSKRSGPLDDQPFSGLLRPENLSREELVDVLRAAVVDQKGERETSGLVLLSSCPQTASRLQKFFTHSQRARRPTVTYCAVTDGIPATSEGTIQAALKLEHIDGVNLVVPVKSPSRKDILEGVKRTLSYFRVVATGSGCALVQLQPLTAFPSQLQAHMALQLCPLLGDHTHSARVATVLGQRFLLPAESTRPQRQVLDEALLSRLHLTPSQAAQLPLHLHLHCLYLPGTRPRDPPIKLLAPLPSYFSRTLHCLGLHYQ